MAKLTRQRANASGARVLYSSGELHSHIKALFSSPSPTDRRVALVAYLGADAPQFLPHPKDVQIVCSPVPLATSHVAVQKLQARGAVVRFSDRLHMKVYWSSGRGCVICSANLSRNALGVHGLREAGVLLPPGAVDIDRLINEARPRAIRAGELAYMARQAARASSHGFRFHGRKLEERSFLEWYDSPDRPATWKLSPHESSDGEFAQSAVARSQQEYGTAEPYWLMECASDQIQQFDWLLCFLVARSGECSQVEWMFTDFVVPIARTDKAFDADNPFQAIQVHPLRSYSSPPFSLNKTFRDAFCRVARSFGGAKLLARRDLLPSQAFLQRLAHDLRSS
jgi:hypothetical protein